MLNSLHYFAPVFNETRPERVLESELTFPIAHIPGIDLSLGNPPTHTFRPVPQLVSDPDHRALSRAELGTGLENDTNSLILLLFRIPTRQRFS